MGFTEVLTIVFIVLKLCDVIAWSWWLVLLPEIIAFVFYIAIFLFGVIGQYRLEKAIGKRKRKHDDFW